MPDATGGKNFLNRESEEAIFILNCNIVSDRALSLWRSSSGTSMPAAFKPCLPSSMLASGVLEGFVGNGVLGG
eukprot:5958214-Lingulodinium_polyedra.AAC.1